MVWIPIILAIVVLAGAAGCLWYRQRLGQEIALMSAIATSRAADVAGIAPGTAVEVKGTLRCATPLIAEFSKVPCVYHKSEINREVEYYRTGSDGKRERRTRTESVHSNTKFAPCAVEDDSGKVAINFTGADVEGESVVDRRENEARGVAGAVLSIALGSNESSSLRYTEVILTHDIPVYVMGEVQADRSIGKPVEGSKNRVFVVSRKSEEERSKDLTRSMLWFLIGAIVLLVAAAGLGYWAVRM